MEVSGIGIAITQEEGPQPCRAMEDSLTPLGTRVCCGNKLEWLFHLLTVLWAIC